MRRKNKMKEKKNSENRPRGRSNAALEDKLRKRAYELYRKRQAERGSELEDWLRAEAELVWKLGH
jgi:hypothetical protein